MLLAMEQRMEASKGLRVLGWDGLELWVSGSRSEMEEWITRLQNSQWYPNSFLLLHC